MSVRYKLWITLNNDTSITPWSQFITECNIGGGRGKSSRAQRHKLWGHLPVWTWCTDSGCLTCKKKTLWATTLYNEGWGGKLGGGCPPSHLVGRFFNFASSESCNLVHLSGMRFLQAFYERLLLNRIVLFCCWTAHSVMSMVEILFIKK